MHLKISSAKRWPFCLGHNVLSTHNGVQYRTHSPVSIFIAAISQVFKLLLRADTSDRKSWVMLSGSFRPIHTELMSFTATQVARTILQ